MTDVKLKGICLETVCSPNWNTNSHSLPPCNHYELKLFTVNFLKTQAVGNA